MSDVQSEARLTRDDLVRTEPAPTATPRVEPHARRRDIQGLRAVAVMLVVLFHAGVGLSGGFTGVDVFFAISGFVITSTLVAELERHGTFSFARFYARRVRRLLPALALMLVVVALIGIVASPVALQRTGGMTGIFAALFAGNFYLGNLGTGYFDVSTNLDPLLHTWTLGVEEQFYLVFPLLLFAGWHIGRRLSREAAARLVAAAIAAAVSGASILLAVGLVRGTVAGNNGLRYWFYGSPPRAWEFGAGAVCALLLPWLRRLPQTAAVVLAAAGATLIVGGAFHLRGVASASPSRLLVFPVLGACALLVAGATESRGVSRLLSLEPAVRIGDWSYSWYLWHWPLIVYAKALWPGSQTAGAIAAGASLLPAWISYRYVENPIRFRLGLERRRVVALAAVCVALPVTACVGLVLAGDALARQPLVETWARSQAGHLDETYACDGTFLDTRPRNQCAWDIPHAHGRIVLLGDSNAGQFSEPVVRAANRAGFDAILATHSGCPYADLLVRLPGSPTNRCRDWIVRTRRALVALHPTLVITADRTDTYFTTFEIRIPGEPLTHGIRARERVWRVGLTRALRPLNGAGIPVIVVHPVPQLPTPTAECAVVLVLTRSCVSSVPRRRVDAELRPAILAEDEAIARLPKTKGMSVESAVCAPSRCASVRGDVLMYRDIGHLSVQGAETLTPIFYRAIVAATQRS